MRVGSLLVFFTRNFSLEDRPETTLVRFVAIKEIPIYFHCISIYLEKTKIYFNILMLLIITCNQPYAIGCPYVKKSHFCMIQCIHNHIEVPAQAKIKDFYFPRFFSYHVPKHSYLIEISNLGQNSH